MYKVEQFINGAGVQLGTKIPLQSGNPHTKVNRKEAAANAALITNFLLICAPLYGNNGCA